jgi:hypothetical protein
MCFVGLKMNFVGLKKKTMTEKSNLQDYISFNTYFVCRRPLPVPLMLYACQRPLPGASMQSACWLPLLGAPMYYACRGSYEICLPGALVHYACDSYDKHCIFSPTKCNLVRYFASLD